MITFADLELISPLQRAVAHEGYERPTPIQAGSIPLLLEGRDVLGCAQTGTGKTAAFALPLLQHLVDRPLPQGKRRIRALVLSPTRELAAQIDESFGTYGRFLSIKHTVIFGGVNQRSQVDILRRGVDVLVATPGRLLDLIGQGFIDLGDVEFFVLDEADRMLDMGFIHDVKRVLKLLPPRRQNLLFSATMPRTIEDLGASFLHNPAWVEVTPYAKTVDQIEQRVMFVARADKPRLIAELLHSPEVDRVLVFTRTKHGANRLVKQLDRAGIRAAAIHGNKSQAARRVAMAGFRSGDNPILVATDLAARGIDVEGISHVFNFDLPNEPETYVHRIGRTGRAGHDGIAISFCDETEGAYLVEIEKLIGFHIQVERDQPYHYGRAEPQPGIQPPPPPASHFGRQGQGQGRGRPREESPPRRHRA
ncbi:MAG: DEAD/DEAH box helicase, partial [bacterium]